MERWHKALERKSLKIAKRNDNLIERGPNYPIVVTHMSPSRLNRKLNCRV